MTFRIRNHSYSNGKCILVRKCSVCDTEHREETGVFYGEVDQVWNFNPCPPGWRNLFNAWFCHKHTIDIQMTVDGEPVDFDLPNGRKPS